MGAHGFAKPQLEIEARQAYLEDMLAKHKAGRHDNYNSIIDGEPDPLKRDWGKL